MGKRILLLDELELAVILNCLVEKMGLDAVVIPSTPALNEGTEESIRIAVGDVIPDVVLADPFCFRRLDLHRILEDLRIPYAILTAMIMNKSGVGKRWIIGHCAGFTDDNTPWNRVLEKPCDLDKLRALLKRFLIETA